MAKRKQTQEQKVSTRLAYLRGMISKYAHTWGENPSDRMLAWVDEYNDLKADNTQIFIDYCKTTGQSPLHDAYDLLA